MKLTAKIYSLLPLILSFQAYGFEHCSDFSGNYETVGYCTVSGNYDDIHDEGTPLPHHWDSPGYATYGLSDSNDGIQIYQQDCKHAMLPKLSGDGPMYTTETKSDYDDQGESFKLDIDDNSFVFERDYWNGYSPIPAMTKRRMTSTMELSVRDDGLYDLKGSYYFSSNFIPAPIFGELSAKRKNIQCVMERY